MAKAKSTKLRIFIALQVLFKCTDEKHGINSFKLNEFLEPHNLDCSYKFLKSMIRDLRAFGVDVQRKNGVWIKNPPLTEHKLLKIIFAVSTNPLLSKEEATDILQTLKPVVTIYQEEELEGFVEKKHHTEPNDRLFDICSTIQRAIRTGAKIRYTTDEIDPNIPPKYRLLTPANIYQKDICLYVTGLDHKKKADISVDLRTITDVKIVNTKNKSKEIKQSPALDKFTPGYVV